LQPGRSWTARVRAPRAGRTRPRGCADGPPHRLPLKASEDSLGDDAVHARCRRRQPYRRQAAADPTPLGRALGSALSSLRTSGTAAVRATGWEPRTQTSSRRRRALSACRASSVCLPPRASEDGTLAGPRMSLVGVVARARPAVDGRGGSRSPDDVVAMAAAGAEGGQSSDDALSRLAVYQ